MAAHISPEIQRLCKSQQTVTSLLAEQPSLPPSEASQKLFGSHGISVTDAHPPREERRQHTPEDLELAFSCGQFGKTRPSDLFLKIFYDALCTLDRDSINGVVSPSLMGSCGVLPFSVIAPLPDNCRHMSNLIARAEHEVIIATNYWKQSDASTLITDALRELSRRSEARGRRVVVKVIYDRGSPKQVLNNHLDVSDKERSADGIGLPAAHEIPNIDMEVINFHRPILGTFHAKFMIADRKVGIVCSNNIQDNDNLEMMTHLEGPIVDSLYDMALLTWHDELKPPLPLLNRPARSDTSPKTYETQSFLDATADFPKTLVQQAIKVNSTGGKLPAHLAKDPHYDEDVAGEMLRMQSTLTPKDGERLIDLVTEHLNQATKQTLKGSAPDCAVENNMTPFVPHAVHEDIPIALVNRKPWGALNHSSVYTPQNEAWLSAIRNCERSIFIQSPDINAEPLIPALLDAIKRGIEVTLYACLGYNDLGELLPYQGGTNEMTSHKMYCSLTETERKRLHVYWYVGKDQNKPLHNKFKQRSCHIKLMVVDDHIGIQGSGNQDTQSWYHSQEVNILLDSKLVCTDWLAAIRRNQNTHLYGAVSQEDGIWRDANGKEADGAIGINPGHFAWAKGVMGAINRVRGAGGF